MIIDFTIENFRSFRDAQTLSFFVEGNSKHLKKNIAYPAGEKIGVLRSCGVYGANASGKSNLIKAFSALKYLATMSGDLKDGERIPCYEPYLLSESCKNAPTKFEIEFTTKEYGRFLYGVSFNSQRVLTELLDYYPTRQKANLFKRGEEDSWEDVSFGGHLKGGKKKYAFFSNNTYLSKAGNNADAPKILRDVFNFFWQRIILLNTNSHVKYMGLLREDSDLLERVKSILQNVDTGISGFEFEDIELEEGEGGELLSKRNKFKPDSFKKIKTFFSHINDDGGISRFPEELESAGTRKLFEMLPMLIKMFNEGGHLIIDELEESFHPHISKFIIQLFNDPKTNRSHAQLLYTTHNASLMSPELQRRDQIWLTEKKKGASTLFSLEEFDKKTLKNNSPFDKWYEQGRFGATPQLGFAEIIAKIVGEDK